MSAAVAARAPNPWLIAVVVAIATFMEVLDTTIANVALPYIAGGLGVSEDEASWVVTTYLVSNAISLTASTFLVRRLGRRRFFIACLALFTVSSVLCAFAWNLQALLFFRVLQGIAGGGMVPVSQSILVDSFPPAKRGQAFAGLEGFIALRIEQVVKQFHVEFVVLNNENFLLYHTQTFKHVSSLTPHPSVVPAESIACACPAFDTVKLHGLS